MILPSSANFHFENYDGKHVQLIWPWSKTHSSVTTIAEDQWAHVIHTNWSHSSKYTLLIDHL